MWNPFVYNWVYERSHQIYRPCGDALLGAGDCTGLGGAYCRFACVYRSGLYSHAAADTFARREGRQRSVAATGWSADFAAGKCAADRLALHVYASPDTHISANRYAGFHIYLDIYTDTKRYVNTNTGA